MNPRNLLAALTLVVLTLLVWQLRWVLLVLFGAVVLAVALDVPVQGLIDRFRIQRSLALLVVVVLLIIGGLGVFRLLLPELITQFGQLTSLLPSLLGKIRTILASQPQLAELNQTIPEQFSWDKVQPVGSQLLGFAGGAANGFIQVLLMSLLAVLLALDPEAHRRMVIAATPRPARAAMAEVLDSCRAALGGWLAGMTLSATAVFFLTWAGLAALRVPLALLSALICGVLTFVPTIGPALMVQVLALRLVIQNLEAFLLTPLLLRRTVNLLPTVALTSQLSLGALLGLPGVLLALPLVVVLQVGMEQVVVQRIMDRWT